MKSIVIRWASKASAECIECGHPVGLGPVGSRESEAKGWLCDGCLLEAEHGLGMLLIAGNLLREVAQAAGKGKASLVQVLHLLVFARLYDQTEDQAWPVRPIGWESWLAELEQKPDGV